MGWIKERIEAEKRKHPSLDWARLAEGKIIMQIMEYAWKNNTIPLRDLHNIGCECEHSLLMHESPDMIDKTGGKCSGKFCSCPGYKKREIKSEMRLGTTDGGWLNVLKLKIFLEGL